MDGGNPNSYLDWFPVRNRKRTHAEMASASGPQTPWRPAADSQTSSSSGRSASPRPPEPVLAPLRFRYPGDGLDIRRPASAMPAPRTNNSSVEIVDLTSDSEPAVSDDSNPEPLVPRNLATRPPRYNREIIDLSEDTPPQPAPQRDPTLRERPRYPPLQRVPSSPEVQITGAREIRNPVRLPPIDRLVNDDVQIVEERHIGRGGMSAARPPLGLTGTLRDAMNGGVGFFTRRLAGANQYDRMQRRFGPGFATLFNDPAPAPRHIHLQYDNIGFNLGDGSDRSATPTYDAPPKPPQGFTRSPMEGDVLICPNCGDELCVGGSETKRQVWLSKGCGHVYCGDCAATRLIPASKKKGKLPEREGERKPLKMCVVEGCTRKTAGKNGMVQLFL